MYPVLWSEWIIDIWKLGRKAKYTSDRCCQESCSRDIIMVLSTYSLSDGKSRSRAEQKCDLRVMTTWMQICLWGKDGGSHLMLPSMGCFCLFHWSLTAVQYHICYKCIIQWFTVFKGYTPFVKWSEKSLSHVQLFATRILCHGILQARIPEWVAIPFSRGSSQPRDQTQVSCIAGRFFTIWATREAHL